MILQAANPAAPFLARKLYRYRWLLYELVSRDLKLRYRGSVLGFAWTLLNPLLFMAVYALVFGVYLRIGVRNFPVFLLSGIMAWGWFVSAMQSGTSSIVDGRMYVGKTVFPAELLVIVPVLSNCVNFVLSLPFLVAIVFAYHQHLGLPLILLPVIMIIQALLTVGLLFFVATLNVFFRDLQQLIQYLLMLLFFLVPIVYSANVIPQSARQFVLGDPIAVIIMAYQHIFYYNTFPNLAGLGLVFVLAIVLVITGYATFAHYREMLGEYL
jgi:ABC-type polysaccharide/polyol phosphate export permease